ncbi:type II secretion system major pseudopilin GspG [Variovorax sp.]|jgi:general secretion pathway protein G|uniref:type II secretion system major pseudopilin GspG n=1 Tax=Variovorax sp. TaxID=1871043 RepID=UPI000C5C5836|nr:type II secretion system major pseudopilin GspG [Variovorax sp.]MBS77824.1 type II secretion system protein GspG [Variovorax sp.]TAJ58128.1 MAG: type II secretion system protein GspG [Variovorax sp.]
MAAGILGRKHLRQAPQQGFTLIELMVVLVIMGVLAALIVPNLMNRPDQARAIAARQDVGAIMQALKLYRLDNGEYPSASQGIRALVEKPSSGKIPANWRNYLERLPSDPWGKPYQYLNPGTNGEIDVFSLGADGEPGGEKANADIGSWQL